MTDDATRDQNRAADPLTSTWLSANAGSGKTRVLTDRVARLLLRGANPQHILCLTYTRAAASEMQNRLFRRLGEWAMLDDTSLRAALARLGEAPPPDLARARTLFAAAIETPGGLRIQTIHSFCAALLRQFPLEAGVSPQFRELDDAGKRDLVDSALDSLAATTALADIAELSSDESLFGLADAVIARSVAFAEPLDRDGALRAFGLTAGTTDADIVGDALFQNELEFLKSLAPTLRASDKSTDRSLGEALSDLPGSPSPAVLETLEGLLLTKSGSSPFQPTKGPPTAGLRNGPLQPQITRFEALQNRIAAARPRRLALAAARKTAALHAFAAAFLPAYSAAKEAAGVLDFDDLIGKTRALLSGASRAWVLYRLDGRIDHVLVDEAQDTAPPQWQVIAALTAEIAAGQGGRDTAGRSLFVVGDKKQSIYSFQGADAREFDRMEDHFLTRMRQGPGLTLRELIYSFRSSPAILSAVDTVFAGSAAEGLGGPPTHLAFHPDLPGRVDLWPLVPKPDGAEEGAWYDPVDRLTARAAPVVLADHIAATIKDMLDSGTIQGKNGEIRPIAPGDILILVQRRSALFDQIIRALKAANLPVAGADRLKLAGELAVRDLLALLSFLALPEDGLSLAAALRSPLFGWSEQRLFTLAQGRKARYLWAELRDRHADHPETFAALSHLRDEADFLRPYELLESILTRHHGRRRLLARLGPEAEEGIDELLTQALSYEQTAVPSLTGFLTRAQAEDIEIKRQSDASGGLIRVMTVHGAKGLESEIVVLLDTTRSASGSTPALLTGEDGTAYWPVPKPESPQQIQDARDARDAAEAEERRRLLYVAMTRARSWLILCGAEIDRRGQDWYALLSDALDTDDIPRLETPTGPGRRLSHGAWPADQPRKSPASETGSAQLPAALTRPAPPPGDDPSPVAPTSLGGAKVLGGSAFDEDAALRYGRRIHRLLEHLAPLAAPDRVNAATRLLATGPDAACPEESACLAAEAGRILDAFPDLFTTDTLAEADIAARLPGRTRPVSGTIDLLRITPDRIRAVDFKTNAVVPERPEDIPEGILRQMGAYLAALEQVFPDRPVEIAVLWTTNATLMPLDHGIVREALARATTS